MGAAGGGGAGTGGGTPGGPLQGSSDGFPLIPVIIACSIVLILTVIAVFLILRRRRKKREETKTPPAPEVPAHPYPWGEYRPTDHQGYAPDQQNRGGTHQYGPVGTGLPAGPVPLLAPAPQHQQMLPQTGMGGLPGGAPPALMGSPNQLPYSLPPIQTDEGLQDLNTMALPPAPAGIPQIPEAGQTGAAVGGQTPVNDVPIAPAEGAEGQESDPLAELGSFLSEMAEGITAPASPPVPGPAQIPVRSPAIRPPDGTPAEAGDQAPYMAPSVESPAPVPIPASAPISPPRHMAPPTPPLVIPPPTSTEQSPSDPPEAAPSPGATPAPDTSPGEMSLACHSCGTTYTAVVTSFPALVQCPGCGTQGMLNG